MLTTKKTNSDNPDFKKLTNLFDEYLVGIDGDEKEFFAKFNQIYIDHVIICFEDEVAVSCGAFKENEPNVAEIKRMFVLPEERRKGIAATILCQLETWATESGYTSCLLETSVKLDAAIALYQKYGYEIIPNYGQYLGVASSVCFKKMIK